MRQTLPTRGGLGVIEAWHAAVNAGDGATAGALCTDDVQVGGPRGSGRGRDLLVGWVGHAGVRLEPRRWFCGGGGAVVEQEARWQNGGSDPLRVATAFALVDGLISRVLRYDDLDDALEVLGLSRADEVTGRGPVGG